MTDKVFTPMGARNYAREKRANRDFYVTDPKATIELLKREIFYPEVLEPCSGNGVMAKIIEDAGYKVTASDIHPVGTVGEKKDFMDYWYWHGDIITNPPYQRAQEFVEHALDITSPDAKVAMFLRLLFLESKKRRKLFDKYPPKCVYVFSERLRCYKDGDMKYKDKSGSAIAFAWFVWDKTYEGKTYIEWI